MFLNTQNSDVCSGLEYGSEYDDDEDDDDSDESDIYNNTVKYKGFWDDYGHIEELATNKDDANNEDEISKGSWNETNRAWASFRELRFFCPSDLLKTYCTYQFKTLDEQRKSECTSFLSHARIYVLADKYDIPHLKNIAVRKLQTTFCRLKPVEEDFYDYIADLIKFVYENTPSLSSTKDPLRDLVAHYVAHPELRLFAKGKCCTAVMRECEPFAVDLWKTLIKRTDRSYLGPQWAVWSGWFLSHQQILH